MKRILQWLQFIVELPVHLFRFLAASVGFAILSAPEDTEERDQQWCDEDCDL